MSSQVLSWIGGCQRWVVQKVQNHKIFGSVLIALSLLRGFLASRGEMVIYNDTYSYLQRAVAPLWGFLWGSHEGGCYDRPLLYPLLMKLSSFSLAGGRAANSHLLELQIGIGVLTLMLAGLAGCRIFSSSGARYLWLVFMFLVSMSGFIYPWEPIALTEGPASNGLLALLALVLILAGPAWGMAEAVLAVLVAAGNMFLKDTNSFIGPMLLGTLFLDQVFVRNMPRQAWLRLKEALRGHPRQWLRSPMVILAAGLILASGFKLRDLGQHQNIQRVNVAKFFVERVFYAQPLFQAYVNYYHPPQAFTASPQTDAEKQTYMEWAFENYSPRHERFLLANPGLTFEAFYMFSGGIVTSRPKSYSYLYSRTMPANTWSPDQADWRIGVSLFIHDFVSGPFTAVAMAPGPWPVYLPLALVLIAFILRLKLGRASLFAPMVFLAATFFLHHALSIFYEGGEDYRHALMGTFSLLLMIWLFLFALGQRLVGMMMKRSYNQAGNQKINRPRRGRTVSSPGCSAAEPGVTA